MKLLNLLNAEWTFVRKEIKGLIISLQNFVDVC